MYDFLLVINTNLPPILQHFRDIAFDRSKIAIFYYSSCGYSPGGGVLLGGSPSNFTWLSMDGQGTKGHRNIAKNFNRLSRVHERYRETTCRQTTDGQQIANVNVSSRSLKCTCTCASRERILYNTGNRTRKRINLTLLSNMQRCAPRQLSFVSSDAQATTSIFASDIQQRYSSSDSG